MKRFFFRHFFLQISSVIFFVSLFGLYGLQVHISQSYAQHIGDTRCSPPAGSYTPGNTIDKFSCDTGPGGSGQCDWFYDHSCAAYEVCKDVAANNPQCVPIPNGTCTCDSGSTTNFTCNVGGQKVASGTCSGTGQSCVPNAKGPGTVACQVANSTCKCQKTDGTIDLPFNQQGPGTNNRTCNGAELDCGVNMGCDATDGQCKPLPCVCSHPFNWNNISDPNNANAQGQGNNQYTCGLGTNKFVDNGGCAVGNVCSNNGTTPSCKLGPCRCENPGVTGAGSGYNGMKCGGFSAAQLKQAFPNGNWYCQDQSYACYDNPDGLTTRCQKGHCHCEASDSAIDGQNGIACGGVAAADQNPPHFCKPNEACHDSVPYNPNTDNDTNPQCVPLKCTCQNPNTPGSGKNGMLCGQDISAQSNNKKTVYCALTEECTGTPGKATCAPLTCTCKNPNVNGDVSVICSDKAGNSANADLPNCDASSHMCVNDSKGNATCKPATNPQQSNFPSPQATFPPVNWCPNSICNTALGPLAADPAAFIQKIFGIVLSIAGGVAVLVIIYSGYIMMTSVGNPERVQGAKETLTAAIVGLVFTIFSLVILETIGVDILQLPGFGR